MSNTLFTVLLVFNALTDRCLVFFSSLLTSLNQVLLQVRLLGGHEEFRSIVKMGMKACCLITIAQLDDYKTRIIVIFRYASAFCLCCVFLALINYSSRKSFVCTQTCFNSTSNFVLGSPFKIPVSLLGRSKAHLVRAEGSGLEFGQVGKKQSFVVYVGDAGGGELKASINGPSKAHITLTDYEVCLNL